MQGNLKVKKMFSLVFFGFSLIGFGMAIYHYSQKNKLLQNQDLTAISGKVSSLDISSFGRNADVKIKLSEFPDEIFLSDKHGYSGTARTDLGNDVKIGDTVYLSLKKDEQNVFDTRTFYELKTAQKLYLTVDNYNQVWQKYHTANLRLGLIGGVICLLIAILRLFF
jgi:hypothetical protein